MTRSVFLPLLLCACCNEMLFGAVLAHDASRGEQIYAQQCANCHGADAQGVPDQFSTPLAGDWPLSQLTEYIDRSMPEGAPEKCQGEDAVLVARYVYDTYYSPIAQARRQPARVDLSRLTVRQHRQTLSDIVGFPRGTPSIDGKRGLEASYYKSQSHRQDHRVLQRVDSHVDFDYGTSSPDWRRVPAAEFAVKWEGALLAPETGLYELVVDSNQAIRLYFNEMDRPLIDGWVKSGDETEHRIDVFLLGGLPYPLRLEFSKAQQGVRSKQRKNRVRPAVEGDAEGLVSAIALDNTGPESFVSLNWKRPGRALEPIASSYLYPSWAPTVFAAATPFPPDDRSVGYERGAAVSKAWDVSTTDAAIETASYVTDHIDELAQTKHDDPDRVSKVKQYAQQLLERAFRRPLDDEQRAMYLDRPFDELTNADAAVARVVLMACKSPRFLYREYRGSNDGWDVAARLSYALWDAPPDEELRSGARDGWLVDPQSLKSQALRMVKNHRAQEKLMEFFRQWLKVEHFLDVSKDEHQYPGFTPQVLSHLRESLERTLSGVLSSDAADYRELLLSHDMYVNESLAGLYGGQIPADGEFYKASFDPAHRAGVLTHPLILSGFAYTSESSPIHRGVFIARSLLGRRLRPPPVSVAPASPESQPNLTTRERVTLQTQGDACVSCHNLINPLGFALENFDAVGRYRTLDRGRTIEAVGEYRTRTGETKEFHGVRELAEFLADSEESQTAFVEQLFQYLVKQPVGAWGPETLPGLTRQFAEQGYNIRQLAADIAVTAAQVPQTAPGPTLTQAP